MQAATIHATTDLKLPDAIVVASDLLAGCEVIVSIYDRWRSRSSALYRQFRWVCLARLALAYLPRFSARKALYSARSIGTATGFPR